MHKRTLFIAAILGFVFCGVIQGRTQETTEAPKPPVLKQITAYQITAYRLDFSLNELEDGKKLNTRHYSMNTTDDSNFQDLKIGTRVPVQSEGHFDYLDVGTSIRARLISFKVPLGLDVHADITNFAVPDDPARGGGHPLLRQMVISGSSTVILDKPIIIGSVDDPNSKREYQLEVTITKLK